MLQPYLLPIETAAYVFFFCALLLLLPICVVHYRRFGYLRPERAVVFYSFLFYALCALFLVILPLPEITSNFCEVHTLARQINLIPFKFVRDIIATNRISLREFNLIYVLESFVFLQAFFNFLLLMPLGFYLNYYVRASVKTTAMVAIATTLAFEVTQITGIYGLYPCPYRTFDVDDLILNASGAILGYQLMPLFSWLPDLQQRQLQPISVSPFRRIVAFWIDWFVANTLARILSSVVFAASGTVHPLWLDLVIYAGWFVGVPFLWRGQTVGKKLVKIQLTRLNGNSIKLSQLCIRYSLLILLPVLTEAGFNILFAKQLKTLGYIDGLSALVFLTLLAVEFLLLFGLILIRKDHRGLHEWVSKTHHKVG